ncbi:MAG: potassium channel protein [Cyclobacteriaceae bacterium]|nr:potassium channel protein [Cyclobacteriaceae bacterium]
MGLSILIGICGYMIFEKYSILNAFYMSIITISTVGFREVEPLTDNGKIFTGFYIISNLVFFAFLVSTVAKYIFEGELNKIYNTIMKGREVNKFKGHIIVCGFGRNGRRAAQELKNSRKKFLIIENDEHVMERFPEAAKTYNFLMGDATQDKILINAGIQKATTIITTLPSDSENVFITLTAREMNPEINIISRASDEKVEKKLMRAGANHVVMPDALGGFHMAHIVTKPFIVEFVEMLSGFGDSEYMLEEINYLHMKLEFRDKSLAEMDIRKHTGATVFGFKHAQKGIVFNPDPHTEFSHEDIIILLGKEKSIRDFKKIYTRHFKLSSN